MIKFLMCQNDIFYERADENAQTLDQKKSQYTRSM